MMLGIPFCSSFSFFFFIFSFSIFPESKMASCYLLHLIKWGTNSIHYGAILLLTVFSASLPIVNMVRYLWRQYGMLNSLKIHGEDKALHKAVASSDGVRILLFLWALLLPYLLYGWTPKYYSNPFLKFWELLPHSISTSKSQCYAYHSELSFSSFRPYLLFVEGETYLVIWKVSESTKKPCELWLNDIVQLSHFHLL